MEDARNQFTFYRSYYDALADLSAKDRAAAILAVCAYAIYEELPAGLSPAASAVFKLIKPTLDAGRKKAANGRQKGKQKESKNEAKEKQNEAKDEREQSANEKEREEEKEIENECYSFIHSLYSAREDLRDEESRRKYLGGIGRGVVFLSDEQMGDLLEQLSLDEFDKYVAIVADCEENGQCFTKRTHYQAILDMAKKDRKTQKE